MIVTDTDIFRDVENYYAVYPHMRPKESLKQTNSMNDIEKYNQDLQHRQQEHLEGIKKQREANWKPCLHDSCTNCVGTGVKKDGSMCVHMISCPCPKCSVTMMSAKNGTSVTAIIPSSEWFKDQFKENKMPYFITKDDYVVGKWHDFHDGQKSNIEGRQTIAVCKNIQDAYKVYASNLP